MKKKLSNKTFFHNQPYTATAPLEGDEMMRPASPKAELWSAAHKVSTKGKCGVPWSLNQKQALKTLIITRLRAGAMLRKNKIIQKTHDCASMYEMIFTLFITQNVARASQQNIFFLKKIYRKNTYKRQKRVIFV